jgi:Zn-dependent M32 family carboxypeptidase
MFGAGEFQPLKDWLNSKVHVFGKRFLSPELGMQVTGKPLSHGDLLEHLHGKLSPIYGF